MVMLRRIPRRTDCLEWGGWRSRWWTWTATAWTR
jgi:hypothetical protein